MTFETTTGCVSGLIEVEGGDMNSMMSEGEPGMMIVDGIDEFCCL